MRLGGCFLFGLRNGGFVSSRCREVRVGGFSPPTPLGRTDGPAPVAKNLIFCSHDCFDTCRPGGQPKVFPLDPLILFGDSTLRGKKGAGCAEGEPWVCPLPCRSRKEERAEIFNFGAGCRARVGPAEGCSEREATNSTNQGNIIFSLEQILCDPVLRQTGFRLRELNRGTPAGTID